MPPMVCISGQWLDTWVRGWGRHSLAPSGGRGRGWTTWPDGAFLDLRMGEAGRKVCTFPGVQGSMGFGIGNASGIMQAVRRGGRKLGEQVALVCGLRAASGDGGSGIVTGFSPGSFAPLAICRLLFCCPFIYHCLLQRHGRGRQLVEAEWRTAMDVMEHPWYTLEDPMLF